MEFDSAEEGRTNYETVERKFAQAGYECPSVVFWNVNSLNDNTPVRFDKNGVALVSGYSTNILKQVLGGEISSPEQMMLSVLNKPEYDFVKTGL